MYVIILLCLTFSHYYFAGINFFSILNNSMFSHSLYRLIHHKLEYRTYEEKVNINISFLIDDLMGVGGPSSSVARLFQLGISRVWMSYGSCVAGS